ncbi:hypothetical protein [Microvirga arabica]|uniref:hypothetical protein n=1 Tax=Microvirga arabica TaxID=1128671 RepID=UPI00193A9838|nr:hypothetical protein [Microvirga arabica]MBM1175476.1 hypothetical protein [Microvirga arabica]
MLIVSPVRQPFWPLSGRNSTYPAVQILRTSSQRQWSDKAIARTTPVLLGLFALVTMWAGDILAQGWKPRRAAWYAKSHLTFGDALAVVRAKLWSASFETSRQDRDHVKIPRAQFNRLTQAACFPA